MRLPSCKLAEKIWRTPEPIQYTRDEGYLSQELEWMERNQHGSDATGSGGIGTQDTTLIERVEPSSVVAAGDRLPDYLNSSYSSACPGDTQDSHRRE